MHSSAQSPTVFNISIAEGLPSSEVYDIFQDRQGFLWLATDIGVVRYDGREMTILNADRGLIDPVVFGFVEDKKGRIWFRSHSGKLSYYENNKIVAYDHNDLVMHFCGTAIMTDLIVGDSNRLWFAAIPKFVGIDSTGHSTEIKMDREKALVPKINGKYANPIFRNPKEINEVEIDGKAYPIHIEDTTFLSINTCSLMWRNMLYFSINGQVFRFDGVSVQTVFSNPAAIICLTTDNSDNLWIGLKAKGLVKVESPDFETSRPFDFLSTKSVTKILQDDEDGYWIATLENGIYHIPNLYIKNYSLPTQSKARALASVDGAVVIGDYDGALYAVDNETKKVL